MMNTLSGEGDRTQCYFLFTCQLYLVVCSSSTFVTGRPTWISYRIFLVWYKTLIRVFCKSATFNQNKEIPWGRDRSNPLCINPGQVILISTRVPYLANRFGHWCPVIVLHRENLSLHTESPLPQIHTGVPYFPRKFQYWPLLAVP